MPDKIDSDVTGLRFTEESALRTLASFTLAVAATGTLTIGGLPVASETITIGARTYTWRATIGATANEILIGATATASAANLVAAVMLGEGSGTIYGSSTTANTQVSASAIGSVVTVTALTPGAAGNAIATTETMTAGTFAAVTLLGGADAVGIANNWWPLEPNSYADFGGSISTIARNPINPTRQRKKGVITDLDASGGFNQDLTFENTTRLMQGFLFADIREKKTTKPLNTAQIPITATNAVADTYTAGSGMLGFLANQLVFASGFTNPANNGLKVAASASTATVLTVGDGLVTETPPATAFLDAVGYEFAVATLNVVMSGLLPILTRASGSFDFTTLGLIPGEWIFLGGDAVGNRFNNNVGFARVMAITATTITLDKTSWTPQAETGTGKTVRMFFGDMIKNESSAALIKRRTYQVERTLGNDGNGIMSEYLVGAVCNEFTLNVSMADKVTVDMAFIAMDNEQRDGLQGVKAGNRPALAAGDAFNTSSDFSRIKLSAVSATNSEVTALFAFATEMSITINNNASPNKAIGVLGGFDISVGSFEVGGSMTAYFADLVATRAVRNNDDITLDFALVKKNQGMIFDIPLIALGDGRLAVEQNQPITMPLETSAAESSYGHTLQFSSFSYLPDLAG
jgi:hypothetical protein